MKNEIFATNVAMKVSREQFERDLRKPLIELGYGINDEWNNEIIEFNFNFLLSNPSYGKVAFHNHTVNTDEIIHTYNPKLYLALAGMTKGETPIVGEWMVITEGDGYGRFRDGEIFKVINFGNFENMSNVADGWVSNICMELGRYRKATKEELIKHFTKEEETMKSNCSSMPHFGTKEGKSFPLTLKPKDAQRIIDISCSSWKDRLASMWAVKMVLNEDIIIEKNFYADMREACDTSQNELLDDIFGENEKEFTNLDLEVGETMIVTEGYYTGRIIMRTDTRDFVDLSTGIQYNIDDNFAGKKVKINITHELV